MTHDSNISCDPTSGGIAGAIDSAADKAKTLVSNAGEFVDHAKEKVQAWAHNAKDRVMDAAGATGDMATHVKERAQEMATTAGHNASDAIQSVGNDLTQAIRKYPMQSVLIGAALGYLLVKATSKG